MSTVVDIGAAMAKWVKDIEYHRDKVKELEGKIQFAKELMTFPAGNKGNAEQKPSKRQKSKKTTIRSRIIGLLAESQKWLTSTEIAQILVDEGFKTTSKNVNTLIATTANKICDSGDLVRRKRQGRVQFAVPNLFTDRT